jgi:hypothetical protein
MCRKDCCRRHRDQQPHAPRGAGGTRLPRNRRVAPPPERACLRSNRVSPPAPAWLGVSWSQAAPPVVANGTRPSLHISALSRRHRRQFRQRKMEPLWSPVVATGGNRWQMGPAPKRLKQTKTVAVGCDRLPKVAHGKEGSPVRVRKRALREATQKRARRHRSVMPTGSAGGGHSQRCAQAQPGQEDDLARRE